MLSLHKSTCNAYETMRLLSCIACSLGLERHKDSCHSINFHQLMLIRFAWYFWNINQLHPSGIFFFFLHTSWTEATYLFSSPEVQQVKLPPIISWLKASSVEFLRIIQLLKIQMPSPKERWAHFKDNTWPPKLSNENAVVCVTFFLGGGWGAFRRKWMKVPKWPLLFLGLRKSNTCKVGLQTKGFRLRGS